MSSARQRPRLGFVGLGPTGAPLARAAAQAGYAVSVWSRRAELLRVLDGVHHEVKATPAELGLGADIVVLSLPDDDAVRDVLYARGLISTLRPNAIVVNHGFGEPQEATRVADRALAFGIHVLDAPACGGATAAQDGVLTTIVGGDAEAFARCEALFDLYSASVRHVGGAGRGQLSRLAYSTPLLASLH